MAMVDKWGTLVKLEHPMLCNYTETVDKVLNGEPVIHRALMQDFDAKEPDGLYPTAGKARSAL